MRFGAREMIFVVLLLAMPVAAYFFVFEPRNKQIVQARMEIRDKQAKLEQLETATRTIPDLDMEIIKLADAVAVFEQKLPAEQEVEVILKEVWNLADRHGLRPRSVRTDRTIPGEQYAEMPIKMVIVGDFDGYYSFLLDLEKLRRITRMPQMKLKKIPAQEGAMEAEVVLSIFFDPRDAQGARKAGS